MDYFMVALDSVLAEIPDPESEEYQNVIPFIEQFLDKYDKDKKETELRNRVEKRIEELSKERTIKRVKLLKEELVASVWHPDRLERMSNSYNIDCQDYMDLLE